jgi:hypothetical protein
MSERKLRSFASFLPQAPTEGKFLCHSQTLNQLDSVKVTLTVKSLRGRRIHVVERLDFHNKPKQARKNGRNPTNTSQPIITNQRCLPNETSRRRRSTSRNRRQSGLRCGRRVERNEPLALLHDPAARRRRGRKHHGRSAQIDGLRRHARPNRRELQKPRQRSRGRETLARRS